jgi:hypothetical protein
MGVAIGTALVIIAVLFSIRANADDNVQQLLQACSADNPSYDLFYCAGRVGGIADVLVMNGLLIVNYNDRSAGLQRLSICPGNPAPTHGAEVQIFKNWAQSHPERWGERA